jgi:hypothetical protein
MISIDLLYLHPFIHQPLQNYSSSESFAMTLLIIIKPMSKKSGDKKESLKDEDLKKIE